MQPDEKLDLCGVIGPCCFLQCKSILATMKPGSVLEVLIRDSETLKDLVTILERSGELILGRKKEQDRYRLVVRKSTCLQSLQGGLEGRPRFPHNRKEKKMSSVDLGSVKAANSVDARGSACPGPLLEAKKGIGKVKVGEVLEVLSNDQGTRNDLPIWAAKVGHEYLGYLSVDGYDKLFILRKK